MEVNNKENKFDILEEIFVNNPKNNNNSHKNNNAKIIIEIIKLMINLYIKPRFKKRGPLKRAIFNITGTTFICIGLIIQILGIKEMVEIIYNLIKNII